MSNQKSMELGLNQNIKYKGVVYHIQSEDGGKQNPVLTTHLFKGGVILSTRRDTYDPALPGDDLTAAIKKIIATHYKALLLDLKEGKYAGGENYVRKTEATKPGEGPTSGTIESAPTPAQPAASPPVVQPPASPPIVSTQPIATPPVATPPSTDNSVNGFLKMPPSIPDSPPVAAPSVATPPVTAPPVAAQVATPPVAPSSVTAPPVAAQVATPPVAPSSVTAPDTDSLIQQSAPPVVEKEAPVEILDIEDIILDGPGSSATGSITPTVPANSKEKIDDIVSGSAPQETASSSGASKKKKTIDEIILEHLSLDD